MRKKPISRRAFVAGAAACAGAGAILSTVPAVCAAAAPISRAAGAPATVAGTAASLMPVVGFHMDRPYLDPTGLAQPYTVPAGTRSGQPLAELDDAAFLSRFPEVPLTPVARWPA